MTAVLPRRVSAAVRLGSLASRMSRAGHLGAGGVVGGRVVMAISPDAARALTRGRDVTLVSGTNGKSTTTAYLAAALRTAGPVDTNADGANTRPGLVRTLAGATSDEVVLETDEGWLPWALQQVPEATPVLLNLSRDQLHRHHEVARLAHAWHGALAGTPHVVANADDPAVVMAAMAARDHTWVSAGSRWRDSAACPACGHELLRQEVDWRCRCGLRRPRPQWSLEGETLVGHGARVRLGLSLPGAVNRANAAMAVAAAVHAGVPRDRAVDALHGISSVAGRYEVFTVGPHRVRLLLAKNPASWLEALDVVAAGRTPVVLCFNSEGVDGRDPSWLYDVPFGAIAGRPIVVTGRRATDLLVRLELDGPHDLRRAEDVVAALALIPAGEVHVVANYTAFQDARRGLARAA